MEKEEVVTNKIKNVKFETIKKLADIRFRYKDLGSIDKLESNSPPSVFVGSKLKYPLVNVGILSPLERDENAWIYENAKYWADENFQVGEVVKLRDSLLNSRFQSRVSDVRVNKKFIQISQEIALASKPVDVEIELKNRVNLGRDKDKVLTPHGMRAPLKNARITENVKIDKKVDRVINDEIKASEGMNMLYKNNFNEYFLSQILSIGVLGLKKNKKLVPTRWSITATDDSLGKNILESVRNYPWIEDYELFYGEFMGNQYLLLLFPNVWSYELFELYLPKSSWNPSDSIKASTDFESYDGRKEYAFNTAGGYYASRLPILEYLNSIKRQAAVIAIRLETPSYWAALGVWVCRESTRKAISKKPLKFNSKEELVNSAKSVSIQKYNYDLSEVLKQSKLLKIVNTQKSLKDFFK